MGEAVVVTEFFERTIIGLQGFAEIETVPLAAADMASGADHHQQVRAEMAVHIERGGSGVDLANAGA